MSTVKDPYTELIGLKMPLSLGRELTELAELEDRSVAYVLRKAAREFLDARQVAAKPDRKAARDNCRSENYL